MSGYRNVVFLLILSILFSSHLFIGGIAHAAVGKWEVFELTLTAANSYSNEYTDVTLTGTFTSPSLNTIQIPGFWDGGQTWKVRMAPNEIGTWTYVTASTPSDSGLETSGTFECITSGKKGFVQVNPSDPYKFQYTDGTPFFWMGDTSWHLYSDHIDYDTEFKDYIDRRASQHFNNVHGLLDVRCQLYGHEVGEPFVGDDFDWINPGYFKNVDRKIDYIMSKDMVAGLFLTWAQRFIQFSQARFERYETYAIARYAAYNVYWVISGEFEEEATVDDYRHHGNFIDQLDPYDHPISIHTLDSCNEFGNDGWLTYVMHQNGEQDSTILLQDLLDQLGRPDITPIYNRPVNIGDGDSLYDDVQADRTYNKPVVNGEFGYEAYEGWNDRTGRTTPDTVRRFAWNLVMAGGFFTYGMDATYKAFDRDGKINWHLPVQELGGSDCMKLLYEFFAGTKWWNMNPDNNVIKNGDAVALVNPGAEYIVYMRSGNSVSIDLSSVSGNINGEWFDTKDGDTLSEAMVTGGGTEVFTKPGGIDGEAVLHLYTGDLVISGLGSYPSNGGYVETFAGNYAHKVWGRVNWSPYNSANGETRIATGDVDGDGRDEIVIGLGPVGGNPTIPGGWFELLDENHVHLAWGRVNWSPYNSANGESWPACGDIDGDGRDEIIIGLGSYPTYGGWFEVFDYDGGSLVHKVWGRINWSPYNSANGETRPACGDIDGDGRDEIVIGFSSYPANGGWFEIFDYDGGSLVHKVWGRINWSPYNSANGETRPACGDIDGDGYDEIIIGLGLYPTYGGWFEVFDYDAGILTHKVWRRVSWSTYNSANGETRPACGDIDSDGRDEIVIGLGDGGGGYLEVFDDAAGGYAHLGWPRIWWSTYSSADGETWPAVKK